ncbi:DUF6542 domain-containing protein [Gordonia alkaliphila]|uniref:DUF6542 domain-containing protein n=1 Tax=Gordonia alkaliphila TaxID=1053547 RepID=A0ABP8ZJQ1_9ACTN
MLSTLTNRTPVPADKQSVLPGFVGVPWWGALLIAAGCTALGATIDSLINSSLGLIYNVFFLIGCVVAALAVRRRALFTAAVQPPLITLTIGLISLFSLVSISNTSGKPQSLSKTVLNIAMPYSNLFPWIITTFVLCVAIAVARWYFTREDAAEQATARRRPAKDEDRAQRDRPTRDRAEGDRSKRTPRSAAKSEAASPKNTARKNAARKGAPQTAGDPAARRRRRHEPTADAPVAAGTPAPERRGVDPRRGPHTAAGQNAAGARPADPTRPAARPGPDAADRRAPARPRPTPAAAPERPRPVRKSPTAVGESQNRPVRRAEPQVIPARPNTDHPRRTAGQQLRDQGAVEDLTLGLDD